MKTLDEIVKERKERSLKEKRFKKLNKLISDFLGEEFNGEHVGKSISMDIHVIYNKFKGYASVFIRYNINEVREFDYEKGVDIISTDKKYSSYCDFLEDVEQCLQRVAEVALILN